MRIFLLMFFFLTIYLCGCCNCNRVNDFGKCLECDKCTHSKISANSKITVAEVRPFACEPVERMDLLFPWEEAYKLVWELRVLYTERLLDANKWCQDYSQCAVSESAWKSYWQELAQSAIELNHSKTVLAKRLRQFRNTDWVEEKNIRLANGMRQHLHKELETYSNELVTIVEKLNIPNLISNDKKTQLKTSSDEFEKVVLALQTKQSEDEAEAETQPSLQSEQFLAQLRSTIQNIQKVEKKK